MPWALVTGGGIRVGRAICLELGRAGYDVIVHANRSRAEAQDVVLQLVGLGRQARVELADLSDAVQVRALAGRIDTLHLLVNSAARYEHKRFADISADDLHGLFSVNVFAPFALTQALLPVLERSQPACVVNITDMAVSHAYTTSHFFSHYLASKAALDQLTRAWALELGPSIRVNSVAPGPVAMAQETSEQQKTDMLQRIPLKREGSVDDVARAVRFLAESPYITGQTLRVDGGLSVA